jgi:hypothetical protein
MTAETDDDGSRRHVEASTDENGLLKLMVDGRTEQVGPGAVPASFWNPAVLTSRIAIDAVNGEAVHPIVRRFDDDPAGLPSNLGPTTRYSLTSDHALKQEMWFDRQDRLVRFTAFAPDGSSIDYRIAADP